MMINSLDFTPIIESGKVFLPHQAIWLNDFEYEILMFPEARHNDQVDSTVQYLQWIRESTARVAAIRTCDLSLPASVSYLDDTPFAVSSLLPYDYLFRASYLSISLKWYLSVISNIR